MSSLVSCHPLSSLSQKYTLCCLVSPWIILIGCCHCDYDAKTLHLFRARPPLESTWLRPHWKRMGCQHRQTPRSGRCHSLFPLSTPDLDVTTRPRGTNCPPCHHYFTLARQRERERDPFPLSSFCKSRAEPISGTKGPPGQSRPEREEWLEF